MFCTILALSVLNVVCLLFTQSNCSLIDKIYLTKGFNVNKEKYKISFFFQVTCLNTSWYKKDTSLQMGPPYAHTMTEAHTAIHILAKNKGIKYYAVFSYPYREVVYGNLQSKASKYNKYP